MVAVIFATHLIDETGDAGAAMVVLVSTTTTALTAVNRGRKVRDINHGKSPAPTGRGFLTALGRRASSGPAPVSIPVVRSSGPVVGNALLSGRLLN